MKSTTCGSDNKFRLFLRRLINYPIESSQKGLRGGRAVFIRHDHTHVALAAAPHDLAPFSRVVQADTDPLAPVALIHINNEAGDRVLDACQG